MRMPADRIASRSMTAGRSSTYSPMKSCRPVVSTASAWASVIRRTPARRSARYALARSCTGPVMSPPAGPPSGGLYLKPPSRGGLCDGVTTMPSARRGSSTGIPTLWTRIACDRAGVGVYRSAASTSTRTPLAASTSSAVVQAGSLRAWVSRARKSGPPMPAAARWSQMAWVVAAMWSSLKAPSRDEPRWPEVPNATRWPMSAGSGWME